jgi:uncharacterized protein YyaL (SSP411 family)
MFMADESQQNPNASTPSGRSLDEIRRDGNHLRDASSLYLRQHAHNPLDWYPWCEEALARAKAEDKPIFLSIGYSSCHWCHVMEHEVFDHDDVAEFLNQHFICIKVDREERPDLDSVYMSAVQTMTGQGGWPLSVFLTSTGQPFFGGTYFPHDAFLELVQKILEVYREKREEVTAQAARLAEHVTTLPRPPREITGDKVSQPPTAEMIADIAAQAPINADIKWGGFAGEQKFPTPIRWQFLLHHFRRTGDRQYANLLRQTLEAMASGGIYDHVGGGFHRYTVEKTWLIPHFEKMLYDNAQLASLYLEAGAVLERADFLAVGKDVLDFLLREMRGEEGAFYGSFDADSGGVEGSYYVWSSDDLTLATNAEDGPVLARILGVEPTGNFEGDKSVLTRRSDLVQIAAEVERDADQVARLFLEHRQALRDYRAGREAPGLDRKIVTSWNGLTISALAHGYAATGIDSYRQAAVEAAAYLWRIHHRGEGRLFRASNAGEAAHEAILDDYALFAGGLLDLYQVTGDVETLTRALALIDYAREHFARQEGGFFLTAAGAEAPLGRKVELFDSVIPSGNAALLQALLRAAALTGNSAYYEELTQALSAFTPLLERVGLEMACWADVAAKYNGPFYEVIIAGESPADQDAELTATVLRMLPANAVLVQVPASGPDAELAALLPPASGKQAAPEGAVAYVCEYGACQEPTSDPAQLRQQLLRDWVK